jgi:hypothetical protein
MLYEVPDVEDDGAAMDVAERQLRGAIRRRDGAMEIIERSRRGPHLPVDEYVAWKLIHGNAEGDAHRFAYHLHAHGRLHYGVQSHRWMIEQDEIEPRKYRLETVWQCWRDVVEARKEYDAIPDETVTDRWGCDPINIVSRRKIDAKVKMEAAEGLYDVVCRAFEGRARRDIEQTIGLRVKPPKRPLPTKSRDRRSQSRRSLAAMMEC